MPDTSISVIRITLNLKSTKSNAWIQYLNMNILTALNMNMNEFMYFLIKDQEGNRKRTKVIFRTTMKP